MTNNTVNFGTSEQLQCIKVISKINRSSKIQKKAFLHTSADTAACVQCQTLDLLLIASSLHNCVVSRVIHQVHRRCNETPHQRTLELSGSK